VFELLAQSPALFIALTLVLGLLVGSFLNVVIYRLPVMLEREWRAQCAEHAQAQAQAQADHPQSANPQAAGAAAASTAHDEPPFNLVVPRSACPHCRAPISALQNIPLISWLLLRGRCANCKAPISKRYPLIELVCGLLSAVVAWKFGWCWQALAALLVTWYLIALTGIDIDHQLLPDALTLPLLWGGLVASLWWSPDSAHSLPVSPSDAIIGAAAGYLSLWCVYHLFKLLTGKDGMGYGDFKLLAALGAWLGWHMLLPIVLCSAAVGAFVGIALIVGRGRERGIPIAFGPFLAAAGWLAMMWGPQWVASYLGLFAHSR
jgi:leader peptidase (prepilin peptidase)/N-methyltransferase